MGLLSSVVGRGEEETIVTECRHCGTSVDESATNCPTCNSSDIVTYNIR